MIILVEKCDNGLVARIPEDMARVLGLVEGCEIEIQGVSGASILRPLVAKSIEYSLEEMLGHITPETLHPETEWGSPVGREHW